MAELRCNMSWSEFQAWMQYRAKHGPLHIQPHIEHAAALVAYVISGTVPRGKGQKSPGFMDFLPQRELIRVQEPEPIDLETAMATWR